MSEYKIVIGYHTLAGDFCVVNGYFSNLRCLMNTLSQSALPEGGGLMEVQLYQENVSLFYRNLVQFQYFVFSPKQAIVHPIPRLSLILTQLIFKASVKPELLYFYQAENPLPISMHFLFSPVNLFKQSIKNFILFSLAWASNKVKLSGGYYMAVGFRHAVGQFSVLNLFYGPKFQKQMPILQL